jgi:hypothetical protein
MAKQRLLKAKFLVPALTAVLLLVGTAGSTDTKAAMHEGNMTTPRSTIIQQTDKVFTNEITASSGAVVPVLSEIRALIERFSADDRSLNRYYIIPFSKSRSSRFAAFYKEWLENLKEIDFKRLNIDEQIDYILFKNHLNRSLRQLKLDAAVAKEAAPFLPFADTIIRLNEDLRKIKWIDGEQAAKALAFIEAKAKEAHGKIKAELTQPAGSAEQENPKLNRRMVYKTAAPMVSTLRAGLKDWFGFYDKYDPDVTWWASTSYKAADKELEAYESTLRKITAIDISSTDFVFRVPAGRQALAEEAAYEFLPYSPEELLAIGWQELEWCEKERLAATRELGYGEDWKKAIEHVKKLSVKPGEQPELIRFLTFEAIDFLEKNDSLTIPPMVKELIRVVMMSPERQRYTPFFTGGEVISVAYPTNDMPYEQKVSTIRGNNPHFSRAVVHHELVPGHNLQMFMAARHKSYRRPFGSRFFLEGWPLYWEMRLWDMNFQRSAEDRIGMLFWRMHRCARIIFSLNFQMGEWTGLECIDFLVDRIGHERDNATVEVTRDLGMIANPLGQCSYLIGGLQMRALSRELVDSGKMKTKDFHDASLREGSIPMELLRAKLTKQKLESDFASQWKFYKFNPSK